MEVCSPTPLEAHIMSKFEICGSYTNNNREKVWGGFSPVFVYIFTACDWPRAGEFRHVTFSMTSTQQQVEGNGEALPCDKHHLNINGKTAFTIHCLIAITCNFWG